MMLWGTKHFKSSAYHPESQGSLERFHQTLKTMIKAYCYEFENDWDEGIHFLLFAVRESCQESLGFSPFELIFGHNVRGPLKVLKEKWLSSSSDSDLLTYVSTFRSRLAKACEIAKSNLKQSQKKMKVWYDRRAKQRSFEPNEKVLILFPVVGSPLQARYHGPYVVERKLNEVNYIIATPDRRKKRQLSHINMLKKYVEPVTEPSTEENEEKKVEKRTIALTRSTDNNTYPENKERSSNSDDNDGRRLDNSEILQSITERFQHLLPEQKSDLVDLFQEYEQLFEDVPRRTTWISHDVDVGDASPIKQHPYRANPFKLEQIRKEVKFLLDNDMVEESCSDWSSPCLLVPKPDGSFRFCTDYRKVNAITKVDCFPIPRIDDCIDRIGKANYISKIDLLKGYWQVPLTEKAKEISAFSTPDGLFQYKVMPFGMKNAPATFQRLINKVVSHLHGTDAYIDDIDVYSDTWHDHVQQLKQLFDQLTKANLTVNLAKSEFGKASVKFLGHIVGQGKVKLDEVKVKAIHEFPAPSDKKQLMRFLGMSGYFRKFCQNFSEIVSPLTNLLRKDVSYNWSTDCQKAFEKIKAVLTNYPVLKAPDFSKEFMLAVDASESGVGAVLLQKDDNDVEHPVCYYSKKLLLHQRKYSTIEKEALALVQALRSLLEEYIVRG